MKSKICLVFCGIGAAIATAQFSPLKPEASKPDPNRVVITVDGRDVTAAEIENILKIGQPDFMQQYQQDPRTALMNWFVMLQLGKEGEAKKLDQTSPFKEQIDALRMNILAVATLSQEGNGYPVTAEMVSAYLAAHAKEYEQWPMKAIYISFRNEAVATDTSPEGLRRAAEQALTNAATKRTEVEAKTLADDLVKQLRAGADLAKLAETYSEDATSKAKGGDFGILRNNKSYPEEFRRIVMALAPGEVSDPIRQGFGFYIVRVDTKTVPPVEEVRAEITEAIRQQHVQEWMNGLTNRFTPQIKDPAFFAPRPPGQ